LIAINLSGTVSCFEKALRMVSEDTVFVGFQHVCLEREDCWSLPCFRVR
jgi:hypothetical protein